MGDMKCEGEGGGYWLQAEYISPVKKITRKIYALSVHRDMPLRYH